MAEALKSELAAFEQMRSDLERDHVGEWVVIHEDKLIGTYETFDEAAGAAVKRFGRGPYLIRQVGAPPVTLPASVMYRPEYA